MKDPIDNITNNLIPMVVEQSSRGKDLMIFIQGY